MYPPSRGFPVPFARPLEGPMHPGRIIAVFGEVPPDCDRFVVNLQCGDGAMGCDVALHLSVRFPEQIVVRNTYQGGWQAEERGGGFPLHPGQHFQLLILCEPHEWKIAFNGQHFSHFHHRLPLERVTHIRVEGNVLINNVTGVVGEHHGHGHRTHDPAVPFVQFIEPIFPGRLIRVRGRVHNDGDRFTFNLACGPSIEHDDIIFHVSVRAAEGVVVVNTKSHKHWQQEHRVRPCPVHIGQPFELLVLVDPHHYKVAFNGVHLTEFPHRMPMERANHVIINGDVHLQLVSHEGEHRPEPFDFHPPPPPPELHVFGNPYHEYDQKYSFFPNPYPVFF